MTKKEFILSQPLDMPAADVVAAGLAEGLQFSDKSVHSTRYSAKAQKKQKRAAKKAKAKAPKVKARALAKVRKVQAHSAYGVMGNPPSFELQHTIDDATLAQAIAERGTTRVRQLVDEIESKFTIEG